MTARQLRRAESLWGSSTPVPIPDVSGEDFNWVDHALCAQTDPEAFFPAKGQPTIPAKKVCMACEVRVDCLEYALDNGERHGIWGGKSERERRVLERQRLKETA